MQTLDKDREARSLILAAFQLARSSGKEDWYRMRSAVLKNRLLDLTNRSFDEVEFGVSSFSDFLAKYDDLVRVDYSVVPPWVYLAEASSSPQPAYETGSIWRIRGDLWRAVMDYSSGAEWSWDYQNNKAVPAQEVRPEAPRLPTLNLQELRMWREEFLEREAAHLTEEEAEAVRAWAERGWGTNALPSRLRRLWNAYQKQCVKERLHRWFAEHAIDIPSDLVMFPRPMHDPAGSLRAFVLKCVREMTAEELRGLSLPAAAVCRCMRES